jgi:hypothetical protein
MPTETALGIRELANELGGRALSRSIARWLQRSDPRLFASAAFLVLAGASFMRASFTTQVDFLSVVLAQLVTGLGIALFMVPLQSISLSGLRKIRRPRRRVCRASSASSGEVSAHRSQSRSGVVAKQCIGRSSPNRYPRGIRATSNGSRDCQNAPHTTSKPIRSWSAR